MAWFWRFLDRFLSTRVLTGDPGELERARLTIGMMLSMSIWGPIFTVLMYTVIDSPEIGHSAALFSVLGVFLLAISQRIHSFTAIGNVLAGLLWLELTGLALFTGAAEGAALMWTLAVPLVATLLSGVRWGLLWTGAVLLQISGFAVMQALGVEPRQVFDPWQLTVVRYLSLGSIALLTMTQLFIYERFTNRTLLLVQASHRQAEAAKASLQSVLGHASDAILTLDDQARIDGVNTAAERLFGYTGPEMVGRRLGDFLTDQESTDDWLNTGSRSELIGRRRDGSAFVAELGLSEIPMPGHIRYVAIVRDVTQRKQQHMRLQDEQRLLKKLLGEHEMERQLLAYEIHDGVVQYITGALIHLELATENLPDDDEDESSPIRRSLLQGLRLLRDGLGEARRLIGGLRPPMLDDQGLIPALEYLIAQSQMQGGPTVSFRHQVTFDRLAPMMETSLYRVCQEALTNARKYSGADHVSVSLTDSHGYVTLVVEDSGVGFDPNHIEENHFGLEGIHERAKLLGGTVSIRSRVGAGCRITFTAPLQPSPSPLPASTSG